MTSHEDGMRTVGEVADLLGISVRTLHHWETRGLIAPAERSWSNYRLYSEADIARLQRAMIYRATGMSLEAVASLLDSETDPVVHLRRQRDLLMEKEDELRRMVRAVEQLLEDAMSTNELNVVEVAQILGDAEFPVYQTEAEERWGSSDDWRISERNVAAMSKADWQTFKERIDGVEAALAEAMRCGVIPGSDEANELAEQYRELLSAFYPVTHAKHVLIAQGYVADPQFRARYDALGEGLADWLKQIIDTNARANGVDPERAEWA